jgi:hypothetical protein
MQPSAAKLLTEQGSLRGLQRALRLAQRRDSAGRAEYAGSFCATRTSRTVFTILSDCGILFTDGGKRDTVRWGGAVIQQGQVFKFVHLSNAL